MNPRWIFSPSKSFALALSLVYSLTNVIGLHANETTLWGERRRAIQSAHKPIENSSLSFSASTNDTIGAFGTVYSRHPVGKPGGVRVIHIQDIHGNLEAQKNISKLVMALARQQQIRLVGLEGASGPFPLEEFRRYDDQEAVKQAGSYFMKKDLIGGPEFAGLSSDKSLTLWGIEDSAPYEANRTALKEALAARPFVEKKISSLNKTVGELKRSIDQRGLTAFDDNKTRFDNGQINIGEYIQSLLEFCNKDEKWVERHFPTIAQLQSALRQEKTMDQGKLQQEKEAVVWLLSKNITKENLALKEIQGGADAFHVSVKFLCEPYGVNLAPFPTLTTYLALMEANDAMDRKALLKEMESLETTAQDALVQTEEQAETVALSRDARLLTHLLEIEMTPGEWIAYLHRRSQVLHVGDRLKKMGGHASFPKYDVLVQRVKPFEDFCARALDRNASLSKNLLAKLRKEHQSVAILVAGGFHTDGLIDALTRAGVSVEVITPKFTPTEGSRQNFNSFTRDSLSLEKLFSGEAVSLKSPCGLTLPEVKNLLHRAIAAILLDKKSRALEGVGNSIDFPFQRLRTSKPHSVVSPRTLREILYSKRINVEDSAILAGLTVAVLIPLIETVLYAFFTPMVSSMMTGDPLRVALSAASLVGFGSAALHFVMWKMQGEIVRGRDFVLWGGFATLFSLPFGFVPFLGWAPVGGWGLAATLSHIHLNTLVVRKAFKMLGKRFGWDWLAQLKPNSLLPITENTSTPGIPLSLAPQSLLSNDQLERNLSIAQHTRDAHSVLYVGAGFDLNHVLTTFLNATHVVMLGRHYIPLNIDTVKSFMRNPIPKTEYESELMEEYLENAAEYGFAGTSLVEKSNMQPRWLAIELLSLGVDPDTVAGSNSGNGVTFELPGILGDSPREITVDFRNNALHSDQPIQINAGDSSFDGVYTKASHDLVHFFEGIWAELAPQLLPNTKMVLNQGPSRSSPVVPGFESQKIFSVAGHSGDYGNSFVVYNLTPQNSDSMPDASRPSSRRMVTDTVGSSNWDRQLKKEAREAIGAAVGAGKYLLLLHESGQTEKALSDLGITVKPRQRARIETLKATLGESLSDIVREYSSRQGGKGLPLASTVLVQEDQSLDFDLPGFKKQTYHSFVRSVQHALDVLLALLKSA